MTDLLASVSPDPFIAGVILLVAAPLVYRNFRGTPGESVLRRLLVVGLVLLVGLAVVYGLLSLFYVLYGADN
jgi:hypothetical protein